MSCCLCSGSISPRIPAILQAMRTTSEESTRSHEYFLIVIGVNCFQLANSRTQETASEVQYGQNSFSIVRKVSINFCIAHFSCLVLFFTIAALVRKVSIMASASIPSTPSIPTPSFPYTAAPTIPIVFTAAPTPPDTPRSELPTMKPTVSDKETEDACCSFDYKTCIKWCGTTKDECLECASSTRWLAQGSMASSNCKARWDGCMGDAKCCPGLVCVQFSKWYGQCSPE